jgi:hypothetical protein
VPRGVVQTSSFADGSRWIVPDGVPSTIVIEFPLRVICEPVKSALEA